MSEIENNFEAQQLNEYYDWQPVSDSIDDPEEIRWTPVAKKSVEENEDVDAFKKDDDFNFFKMMRILTR
jgi:hypothetical protein